MTTTTKIPPRHFFDESVFAMEQKAIFGSTWQFFCLKSELQNDNDFVAESVGGVPVVVQNMKGTLRAFHNVCTHRNSPLQIGLSGNRALFCPYHGWVFGQNGELAGIPHNHEFYPIEDAARPKFALKSFRVETCGQLVFVSLADGAGLAAQLGQWHPLVSAIGEAMDDIHFRTTLPSESNWKFVVNNAFDDTHAQFVHPSSSLDRTTFTGGEWIFHPHQPGAEDLARDYSRRHAQLNAYMTPTAIARNETLWQDIVPERAYRFDHYLHLFLYPNMIITSVQGYWYNIIRYKPLSAGRSEMDHWLVPGRALGESVVMPDFLYSAALSSLRIFEEDVRAVETTQGVIRSVRTPGVLGRREDKIAHFESAYMDVMQKAGAQ